MASFPIIARRLGILLAGLSALVNSASAQLTTDENTRSVDSPNSPNVLSLQWDSAKALPSPVLIQLPLSAGATGKWFAWRASRTHPVLVFDPKLSGKIESGSQIIGATFLGKSFESGYDALATLDKNRDGSVSGAELKGISLWFDQESDGIASPGELRTAVEMDIKALYYDGFAPNSKGDLRLEIGFDRNVAGVTIHGASLAWRSKAFDSKEVPAKELRLPFKQPAQ